MVRLLLGRLEWDGKVTSAASAIRSSPKAGSTARAAQRQRARACPLFRSWTTLRWHCRQSYFAFEEPINPMPTVARQRSVGRTVIHPFTTSVGKSVVRLLARAGAMATTGYYRRAQTALPEHAIGNIRVYGDPIFASSVAQALSRLSEVYPSGYSLVQRYIRGVVQGESRRGKGIFLGVVYRQWRRRAELPVPPDRVAAQLIRQAVKMRKVLGFSIWRSPRSELGSLYMELKAMRLLGCDAKYLADLQNEIVECQNRLQRAGSQSCSRTSSRAGEP